MKTWAETLSQARNGIENWRKADDAWWKAKDKLHDSLELYVIGAPEGLNVEGMAKYILEEVGFSRKQRDKFLDENGSHFLEAIDIICMNILPGWTMTT